MNFDLSKPRLNNSSEEICEILLSKGFVLSALKYASKCGKFVWNAFAD